MPPEEASEPRHLEPAEESPPLEEPGGAEKLQTIFTPLFANMGGIDSWISQDTPKQVVERLLRIAEDPLSKAQLSQLLIISHEAGPSEGFFRYYWLAAPEHTYDVRSHGIPDAGFDDGWIEGEAIRSLDHLRWGLYRFYVDALLYFGNVRSAYRTLRELSYEEIAAFFAARRTDSDRLHRRGPSLELNSIARDDRYLIAEQACKSFETGAGAAPLAEAIVAAYENHVQEGGSAVISVEQLISGDFIEKHHPGHQTQFQFSADEFLKDEVASSDEVRAKVERVRARFERARELALENTALYLSMVEDLDVYVATSMRTRDDFRKMAAFCDDVFSTDPLQAFHVRYFDPTLSAADGHVDKGLIECLMVDAAQVLVYYAGDRESLGKDFEAAMALSRGKPVIIFCDNEDKERMYRDVHPLTRLVDFDTGVANGAIVATSTETVVELLQRIFLNEMEYKIERDSRGSLLLRERLTDSLVRLQTHDRLLQETFWNYYHHKGVMR